MSTCTCEKHGVKALEINPEFVPYNLFHVRITEIHFLFVIMSTAIVVRKCNI